MAKMDSDKSKGHDQLTLKELNQVITSEPGVATKWYKLGVELLDSNTVVLDVIETNQQSDDDRCSRMFKKWLEMKTDASWSKLVTALNNIGLNSAADSVHHKKLSKEVTDLVKVPINARKSDSENINTISTAEQASVEFGVLLNEILKVLKKNENDNLELLKAVSSALTVKHNSDVKMFNDSEVEGIYACNNISILLMIKLRHCYRWDDHSMLIVLMSSLKAEKCLKLLQLFETKVYSKMKLQQLHEHCLQESVSFPEGYHKMVVIVNKIFSDITKEEYDELKQFISQHCGVGPYVMSPFSKVSPFSSMVVEWFIPVNAVSYMIERAKNNVPKFTKGIFLYLKISKTVIFDHRDNWSECDQLLTAAEDGDVDTVERLIHTRYIDVNTTDWWGSTALHDAARWGHVQVVETLIRLGADVNALDEEGRTALHVVVRSRQFQAIETLIRLGADVNALNKLGRTALHRAAMMGHVQVIETMIRLGVDVNALDKLGRTALHMAAMMGHVQVIEALIRLGADVNAFDEGGRTALHHAATEVHVQAIETLIRLGADVIVFDKSTQSRIKEILERKPLPLPSSSKWSDTSSVSSGYSSASGSSGWSSHSVSSTGRTKSSHYTSTSTTKQSSIISDHKSTTGYHLEMKQKEQESKTL